MLVSGDDWSLPRLLVLAGKIAAGVRRNVVRLADGHTSTGAVLKNDQASLAVDEGALENLIWSVTRRLAGNLKKVGPVGCGQTLSMNI